MKGKGRGQGRRDKIKRPRLKRGLWLNEEADLPPIILKRAENLAITEQSLPLLFRFGLQIHRK